MTESLGYLMDYINVWGIAALAGIACLGFFFLLTRRVGSLLLRTLLRCLGAAWILLPAPVPNYPGNFAPAFVVWIFEGVLQSDGEPMLSLQILLWSSAAIIGLVLVWYFWFGRHHSPSKSPDKLPDKLPDELANKLANRLPNRLPERLPKELPKAAEVESGQPAAPRATTAVLSRPSKQPS